MHCYHHAAGDGSTGLLAMKGIFERYSKLLSGEKVDFPNRMSAKGNHDIHTDHPDADSRLNDEQFEYLQFHCQVEETSLTPMESVEEITNKVQLDKAKAKVENLMRSSPSRVKK